MTCDRCQSTRVKSTTEGRYTTHRCGECSLFLGNELTHQAIKDAEFTSRMADITQRGLDEIRGIK